MAAVDKNGKVTAKKTGSAKITVTTKDGKKTAVCTVKVYERIPVYRFYNRKTGDHMYTISEAERESLVKAGWKAEGIACIKLTYDRRDGLLCNFSVAAHAA